MSRLTVQTLESAPEASQPYLASAKARNGYIPNLLGVLANAPTALKTYLTVSEINSRTSFTLAEREVVQITAATNHGCAFCVAGHTAIAYKQGNLPQDLVEGLRTQTTLPDTKLEALAAFTRAVIRSRGVVTDAELQVFEDAGYGEQQVIEVIMRIAGQLRLRIPSLPPAPPLVEALQSVFLCQSQRLLIFPPREGTSKQRFLESLIAGMVLIHQVQPGVGRNLPRQERQYGFGIRQIARQHQMAHQQPASRQSMFVQRQVADLPVHFPDRRLVHFPVVPHVRIAVGGFRIAVFHIRHVDVHHPIQQGQCLGTVVAAGVVDQRQAQTPSGGEQGGRQNLRYDVAGGD